MKVSSRKLMITAFVAFATLGGVADGRMGWFQDQKLCLMMNLTPGQGEVVKVTHLATGREMAFTPTVGDYEQRGVTLNLPPDFVRDTYADAFEVQLNPKREKQK